MIKAKVPFVGVIFLLTLFVLMGVASNASAGDSESIERLENIIMQQQKQIESQAKAIEALRQQVSQIKEKSGSMPPAMAQKDEETPKGFIKTRGKIADVMLYGQVNRGVLISDDGQDTTVYQVDNDNSSTRIGLIGTAKGSETVEAGAKIELQFESNSSSAVNQSNRSGVGDNHFTKRHLDLYLKSKELGKLSVGFGSTASDSTSEADLSGTALVGYSSVVDMAGGQLFHDQNTNSITATKISNAFTNMDGLGRMDRIRYDTPAFYGITAATSYIADGGGDLALRYLHDYDGFKVSAAAAYADPGGTSSKTEYQLGSSLSVLHDSGFSVTAAGGLREYKNDADGDGLFCYAKLGYQDDIFSIGRSFFSVDLGYFEDIGVVNDEALTYGFQFVQDIKNWSTEYYIGFRNYSLDRDNTDYHDINAVLSGFRVKF